MLKRVCYTLKKVVIKLEEKNMKSAKNNDLVNNNEENNKKNKKSYTPPTLKNYGKVSELTKGASIGATEMGTHKL